MLFRRVKDKQKKKDNPSSEALLETVQSQEVQLTFREHYPLLEPYSRAAIVEDTKGGLQYLLLEPTLTPVDESWISQIRDILWDELTLSATEFGNKQEAEEFLKKKVIETARKYKIRADPHTLGKYQYYITRDFLNFAKIDGLMRDENIEDISCEGVGQPLYVWHRIYESISTNAAFKTQEELAKLKASLIEQFQHKFNVAIAVILFNILLLTIYLVEKYVQ